MRRNNSIRRLIALALAIVSVSVCTSCTFLSKLDQSQKPLSADQIYDKVAPSVVRVSTNVSTGTGFFYNDSGTVITNYHVIEGATKGSIETFDGKEYSINTVLGYSEEKDIAILSTSCKKSTPMTIRTSSIKTGEKIYTLGSSLGTFGWTLSDGLISNASRVTTDCKYIQISAPISPGNSGGPLIDEYGNAIGITTLTFTEGQNINFAVSAEELKSIDRSDPKTLSQLSEQTTSSSMYVDNYRTHFDEETGQYIFLFELQDKNKNATSGNGKAIIKIVNDDGTTVYNSTKFFTEKDFGTWTINSRKYYLGAIYIDADTVQKASKSDGTFCFKLYVDDLVWKELYCKIYKLPLKQTVINTPTLPVTVNKLDYSNKISSSVQITNVTFENYGTSGTSISIYVYGKKTYDKYGNNNDDTMCAFKWKLYDADGYLVDSGNAYTDYIVVGDKFKEEIFIYKEIIPGNTYTLKFFDYD